MSHPRNVILIGIDALRADHLGCYGYRRNTSPAIDLLSKEGILFEKCFSQAPNTTPSFMSMLTSLYPTYHGVTSIMGATGMHGRTYILDKSIPTLAEVLKSHSFRTGAFTDGGQLFGKIGFERGFDYYSMNPHRLHKKEGSIQEDEILYWLKEYRSERFFMFFHSYAAHSPWMAPEEFWGLYDNGSRAHFSMRSFVGDTDLSHLDSMDLYPHFYRRVNKLIPADVEYVKALYDGGIRYLDNFINRLWNHLHDLKIASETIVVITADHGEEFMDHGKLTHEQLYAETLHVPLIVLAPNMPRGIRIDQTARSIDIFPTILDLLDIQLPAPIHGVSLVPSLERELGLATIAEAERSGYMYQNNKYKYIYPFHKPTRIRTDELYDIETDPREKKNIALENLDLVEELMYQYITELHRPNHALPRRGVIYPELQKSSHDF